MLTKEQFGFDNETFAAFTQQYAEGDEMHLDDNLCECETYIVGDRRCGCGNRRISIAVDSYEGKAFFYPEAY